MKNIALKQAKLKINKFHDLDSPWQKRSTNYLAPARRPGIIELSKINMNNFALTSSAQEDPVTVEDSVTVEDPATVCRELHNLGRLIQARKF